MKLQPPYPHFPHKHNVDHGGANQEPHDHHTKEALKHLQHEVSHAVEVTLDTVEKGVDAVDRLHIFSPNEIPTRLIIEKGLFERTDTYPILCARSNETFHNLQVKAKPPMSNKLVVEDFVSEKPLIVIERILELYDIYMTWPVFEGQKPVDGLYPRARVIRYDDGLHVFVGDDLTYIISKARLAASYATKHVIKRVGEKEPVAWTHPWEGKSMMIEIDPKEEVLLMFCLAAIAEE